MYIAVAALVDLLWRGVGAGRRWTPKDHQTDEHAGGVDSVRAPLLQHQAQDTGKPN